MGTKQTLLRGGSPSAGDVLRLIRDDGATTRSDLIRATGVGRAHLELCLNELIRRGLIVADAAPSTGGRPPRRFTFNPAAGVIIAADLGATHGHIAVADLAGNTLAAQAVELAIVDGPDLVLPRVLEVAGVLLGRVRRHLPDVWATGIGLPGPVEFDRGRPIRPPIMPGWDDVDVRGWFADRLPGPVLVDNDVNVMALGEYWHSWRHDAKDLLYIKVGTGIGAGLITGGDVFRGSRGAAGDIGHVRVDATEHVLCDCGNEDCLEAVASGRALVRELRGLGLAVEDTRGVVDLVTAGNPVAVRAVRIAGRRLGEVLATAVNLLNPELIVVGGDLAAAHNHLLAGIKEVVYQRSTPLATQSLRVEEGQLADRAGIEGCVVLALRALLSADVIDDAIEQRSTA